MNYLFLTGRENKNLVEYKEEDRTYLLSKEAKEGFLKLKEQLSNHGINLSLVSSYRSFEHQLRIWNGKASGQRKLYDKDENLLNYQDLSPIEIIHAILRWSALPGASRHHWGTEIDVFDANIKEVSEVNLTLKECDKDFNDLYQHLDQYLKQCGFHRPYALDLGGVSPEPWHLSFSKESQELEENYSIDTIIKSLNETQDMQFKDIVLENIEEIFQKYIINVSK